MEFEEDEVQQAAVDVFLQLFTEKYKKGVEFEEDNVQPPVGVFLPLLSFEVQKCKKKM